MIIKLYIGSDKLDLFKSENIEVNSSIADVSDITKNTTEYTKSFTVPASDTNNQIFKHYYNADLSGSEVFDARIKVDGSIELDGIPFKFGKYRLSKVSIKKGVPYSYTINFWGNLVNIKDALKKDELKDLDLSAYNHDYDSATVKTGLQGSLKEGDLIYNLFTKKQLYFNANGSDNTQTENRSNIAYGGGVDSGVIWNDLSPSIKLIRIIEAIESKYTEANGYSSDIVFSRDFFGRTEFTDLFLWLNGSAKESIGGEELLVDFDSGDTTYIDLTTNIATLDTVKIGERWFESAFKVTPATGYEDVEYEIIFYKDGVESGRLSKTREYKWVNPVVGEDDTNVYQCYYSVKSSQEFKFSCLWLINRYNYGAQTGRFVTYGSEQTLASVFVTTDNVPKIKLIDLLKGLFNAFKLVVIPQDDGTIYVNTLKDYYASGSLKNLTRYIDFDSYDVSRGKLLNEINFLFTEPSTILNTQFKKNTGIAYGDEEAVLKDDNGELLDGETLEFTLPFEQIKYERLNDINDGVETNIQYAAIIDEELSGANPKAHIYYNINQDIGVKTLGYINDASTKELLSGYINTPSHTNTFENQTYSFLFGAEYSTWNGSLINNTLYSNYHNDYISSIFNIKRRTFKYSAYLPLRVLLELELNDVIEIKGNYYRIDNYNLNLLTGKVDFTLINSFDNSIVGFNPDTTQILTDYLAQQKSIYVTNLTNFTSLKIDNGSGVGWVAISSSGSNIYFDLTENTTGSTRDMFIDIINDETLQEFQIYINQTAKRVTADNNIITADNNIITADNN